jgi:hypothetical protein
VLTVTGTYYAYPLFIPQTTIKTVNLGVQLGQTGGAAHVGLYSDNGAGYPGSLLVDFGAITGLTSTATVTLTLTTPQPVNSGYYWVASVYTATSTFPNVYGVNDSYTVSTAAQLGWDTAAHALATSGESASGISLANATSVYGALPATFPTGATLSLAAVTPMAVFGV